MLGRGGGGASQHEGFCCLRATQGDNGARKGALAPAGSQEQFLGESGTAPEERMDF